MSDGFVAGTRPSGSSDVVHPGPLSGVRLSVKDVIDVAAVATGAGQPRWAETHSAPTQDADAVALLRAAGAQFVGKSHTDEMAYSLFGSNPHYGTPANPRAPGHLPGGSSSGAAATVAAGTADLGLGTDTAGSIRVPASWCGLFGLRPSHSRVSRRGIIPLAPRFDVPGLLARDLLTLRRAASVLLTAPGVAAFPQRLLMPVNYWPDPSVTAALSTATEHLSTLLPLDRSPLPTAPVEAFAISQGAQAWQAHGDWITEHVPRFGPGVAARFDTASRLDAAQITQAERELAVFCDQLHRTLAPGHIMVLPTTPCPAPVTGRPPTADTRRRLISLTMPASVAGLPALSLPVGTLHGRPLGLCLVAAHGQDEQLLDLAAEFPV